MTNTPLMARGLPDPLGAYKNPFLKSFLTKEVDAGAFVSGGGPYLMNGDDVEEYRAPMAGDAAAACMRMIMDGYDPSAVCREVDDAFCRWRNDTLIAWYGRRGARPRAPSAAPARPRAMMMMR